MAKKKTTKGRKGVSQDYAKKKKKKSSVKPRKKMSGDYYQGRTEKEFYGIYD